MDITYCLQSALVCHITMLSFLPWFGEDAAQVPRSGGSSGEGPIISHCEYWEVSSQRAWAQRNH